MKSHVFCALLTELLRRPIHVLFVADSERIIERSASMEKSNFFGCLRRIPLVSSAISRLGDACERSKQKNVAFRFACQTTEIGLRLVVFTAQPVLDRLEEPSEFGSSDCRYVNLAMCVTFRFERTYVVRSECSVRNR